MPHYVNHLVDGHPAYGCHYDEQTGDFVMSGGSRLSPEGIYTDPYGTRTYGARRLRVRKSDLGLISAIPKRDAYDTRPNPPLVPTDAGWPTPPEGFGWPNLDNPSWDD
ncbi:hypothetical protein [Rhodococcus sp. HNM0569]|uniref:hypothetical protein n=1 Tax=Rhodococcus sp. HNM0569 TaxID=2716340 RepID=UPI00146C0D17|nr:hypothetical protein [Rhodococcus sp. HNM0569]NLU81626.1 hypothetical protein [Rhodococcus sp. HNM0569]